MKNIPYGRQNIVDEDVDAVLVALKSEYLTQGPLVPIFENTVKEYCNAKFAIATNSATSALHIACLALDVGRGSVVWTSPISFVASANCALYCGATVDFVDIDEISHNISIEALEAKLKKSELEKCLPDILIAVHFAGLSCDMEKIRELADRYAFRIIEDASHAIGATYKGDKIGSCKYSDITIFSFHPVKIITTGEGGMALTNNKVLARRMQRLRTHGVTGAFEEMLPQPSDEIWNYQQIELGFNYRMTDLQASLGISQLKRIETFLTKRKELADRYNNLLDQMPLFKPKIFSYSESSWHLYVVELDSQRSNITQKELYTKLRQSGVLVNLHYIPIYKHPYYKKLGFKDQYCPNAEIYFHRALSLPIFFDITDAEQDQVVHYLKLYIQ